MEYDDLTVTVSLTFGILVPFFVISLVAGIVWSVRAKFDAAMNKEQNHANLAAFALTGLVFSTFTVVLDVWALVLVVQESHEFTNHTIFRSLTFVIITTVLDILAVLVVYFILPLCRILIKYLQERHGWLGWDKSYIKIWSQPTCTLWLVASMCFAPLFCIASHSEYITIAWVSDIQHPGPITYLYIISFFYYFIIFRQLYRCLSNNGITGCRKACRKSRETRRKNSQPYETIPGGTLEGGVGPQQKRSDFNLLAFFIEIPLGVCLAAAEVVVIYSLTAFPVTAAAPTDVYFAQLAVVIITGLFTCSFIYTEDRPKQFIKAFVEAYQNKSLCLDNLNTAEKAGRVLGRLAFAITRQYTEDEVKQLREAFTTNYSATDPEDLHVANNAKAVGKVFGKLAFRIKHTDGLMEAFVINFKETNSEGLHLGQQITAGTAGQMLGGLAFIIANQYHADESKQLLEAFVENFKETDYTKLHLDKPYHVRAATVVLGELGFTIIQQFGPNGRKSLDEAGKKSHDELSLKEAFTDTFKDLHLASLNEAKVAGNVLGRLAFTIMK